MLCSFERLFGVGERFVYHIFRLYCTKYYGFGIFQYLFLELKHLCRL